MKNYKNILGLRYEPTRFVDRDRAFGYSKNTVKLSCVILGCDGRFWIVCLSDAAKLIKQGYEPAT